MRARGLQVTLAGRTALVTGAAGDNGGGVMP